MANVILEGTNYANRMIGRGSYMAKNSLPSNMSRTIFEIGSTASPSHLVLLNAIIVKSIMRSILEHLRNSVRLYVDFRARHTIQSTA